MDATPRVLDRPLRTERLTLRPATAEDAAATWRIHRIESVTEWLTARPDDLDGYRERFVEPDRLARTIVLLLGHGPDETVIGDLMIRREDAWSQAEVSDDAAGTVAELGWVLDPEYAGRGYATEAVRELIRYSFEDLGVRRVVANCFYDNDASWRLMERAGMRREIHGIRDSLHRSGRWLDSLGYALLREEWATTM